MIRIAITGPREPDADAIRREAEALDLDASALVVLPVKPAKTPHRFVGRVFDQLTVIDRDPGRGRGYLRCRCTCDAVVSRTSDNLQKPGAHRCSAACPKRPR
jgi:hypothetical protein